MDFEALRARADDIVTGIAADVTESILEVVDDVLTMAETTKYQADQMRANSTGPFQFNIDGVMSVDEVRKQVDDILSRAKGQQAKPAPSKTGGSPVDKDTLVRTIYDFLTENDSRYVYTDSMREYLVRSTFEEDRIGLVQDLLEYLGTLPPNTRPKE